MRGTTLGRTVAAAVAVPVLALSAAACSGGGGDGGGGEGDGKQATGGGSGGGGSGAAKALDRKALRAALLKSGEVKGYKVQPRKKKDVLRPEGALESDRSECAPVADVIDPGPERRRAADASGVVTRGDLGAGRVQQVLLSAYAAGDAEKWLDDVKGALGKCREFTGMSGEGERTRVRIESGDGSRDESGDGSGVGDESAQFTVKKATGEAVALVFTVVRTGANTATFMSVSLSGEGVPVAKPVMARQVGKLESAAGEAGKG